MIQVHVLLNKNLDTVDSLLGTIYKEEYDAITLTLSTLNKTWEDIDLKSVYYNSNKKIPYRCGNYIMHRGKPELEGYHICFRLKKEFIYGQKPR